MALYKPVDYIVALVILFVLLSLTKKILEEIEIDRNFWISMVPIMLTGVFLRVLVDAGVFEKNKWWNVTPGIYVLCFCFAFLLILVGRMIEKKVGIEYWKLVLAVGGATSLIIFSKLAGYLRFWYRTLFPWVLAFLITSLVYISGNKLLRRGENILIVFSQMLDGSGTFIGIDYYRFGEEHILTEWIINIAGTAAVVILVKLIAIVLALYVLDKFQDDKETKIIKFALFILGFGPGTRNSLILALG